MRSPLDPARRNALKLRARATITRIVDLRLRSEVVGPGSHAGLDVVGAHEARYEGANAVGSQSVITGPCTLGYGTTVGERCILRGPVTLGRWCQLGSGVGLYGRAHPTDTFTSYVGRALLDGANKPSSVVDPTTIGNDVWIGQGAVIVAGVTIGDGAVIGANAVVTRDVAAFTVVAGSPARPLRPRFDERVATRLADLRWWDLPPEHLELVRPLIGVDLVADPDDAVAVLDEVLAAATSIGRRHPFTG